MVKDEPSEYPPAWTEEMIQEYEQELAEDEEYLVAEEDRLNVLKEALDKALEQEKNGLPGVAWNILYHNWLGYTDHEYYDDEMAILFAEQLELLYERNPKLVHLKIELMLDQARSQGYHSGGGYDVKTIEDAIKITQEHERPDLELEIIQTHASNQVNRYGGAYWNTEGLRERIEELEKQVKIRLEEKWKLEHAEDLLMPTNDLISDFAEGIMGVCNDSLEERKQANPNDYLDGDEIEYDVLHQSCYELFSILTHKDDAEEVIKQWTNHERWCVRALTQGAEHLLVAGSFNNSLDDSEEDSDSDGDDLDSFVDWVDYSVT
jgi:hypothetical protein